MQLELGLIGHGLEAGERAAQSLDVLRGRRDRGRPTAAAHTPMAALSADTVGPLLRGRETRAAALGAPDAHAKRM